jgi:hypothetical protein
MDRGVVAEANAADDDSKQVDLISLADRDRRARLVFGFSASASSCSGEICIFSTAVEAAVAIARIAFCSEGIFSLFWEHGEGRTIAVAFSAVFAEDNFNADDGNALGIAAVALLPPIRAGVAGRAGVLFGVVALGAKSEKASGRSVEDALTTRAELEANGEKFCDGSS